jgi:PTH2 family peptidyl-tRNA hydrolase
MSNDIYKQMIILRKDLGMRKGKMVAQGAHASMAAILDNGKLKDDARITDWLAGRFTKICVSVNSEEELLALHAKAEEAGMITALIQDAGLTEFNGVLTYTAVAIGPDTHEALQPLTSELKLL